MSLRRLRAMFVKELHHVTRDSRSLAMALAMPMMMLLLYGYALSLDVDHIKTLVFDQDGTTASRNLVRQFQGSTYFQITGFVSDYPSIERAIDKSQVLIGVVIPRGFGKDLEAGKGKVQLLIDGSDSNTASIAMGYGESVVQSYSAGVQSEVINHKGMHPPGQIDARMRVWYNSSLESKNFIVPGLVAVIMVILAGQLSSLTIAREWEMGTMEQVLSTPLRPAEIVLGKMLAYFLVGLVDCTIAIVVAITVFTVPFPRQLRGAGHLHLRVPLVRPVHRHLGLGRIAHASAGLPVRHPDFVPAGIPALRLHFRHRHHAEIYPGVELPLPRALLRHHHEGRVPQGHRLPDSLGRTGLFGALRRAHLLGDGAENESEGGLTMRERLRVILRKEFIQALREPRMRFLLFFPPLLQLVVFGYAVTLDVDHARIGWMDMDNTPESRSLEARFVGSGRFDVVATPRSEAETQSLLDRGQVHGVVRVLPGFARDLARGRATEIQVLLDGTNSNTASLVSAYAGQVIAAYSNDVMTAQSKNRQTIKVEIRGPGVAAAMLTPATAQSRVWFNPDLYSRNYFVPGVAANILLMVTLMLTSQAIIREKEIGTMEQLMVTPMRPIELMLGKTLPFAVVGMVNLLVICGGALLIFHIPFRGSFLLLLFCALLFLMTSLGAGLLLSTLLANAAAGKYGIVLLHHAGIRDERLHVSHPQYARGGAISLLLESPALLHGDRPRHFPEGCGCERVVAADGLPVRVRKQHPVIQRRALPQDIGLD